jgi:hypothetical protein
MSEPGKEKRFHVVRGRPWLDPDCPVCRAHGITPVLFPGRDEPGGDAFLILEILEPKELIRCDCPLCIRSRR